MINGTHIVRQFYYGSKRVATMLILLTLNKIYFVEHPVQRLLLDIAENFDLRFFGGDVSDAFAHIPGPYVTNFLSIDD